jgi:hypothetical protein
MMGPGWDAKLRDMHEAELERAFTRKFGDPKLWKFARRHMKPGDLERFYRAECQQALKEQQDERSQPQRDYDEGAAILQGRHV